MLASFLDRFTVSLLLETVGPDPREPGVQLIEYLSDHLRPFVFQLCSLAFTTRWMLAPATMYCDGDLQFIRQQVKRVYGYMVRARSFPLIAIDF